MANDQQVINESNVVPPSVPARIMKGTQAAFNRVRSPGAAATAAADPDGSIDALRGRRYCLVVTFRRDGTAVPTPVWFGVADGVLYFRSLLDNGKLKRLRHTKRVLVAPCTVRGKPLGPPFAGVAEILTAGADADEAAERAVRGNYGLTRRVYNRLIAHRVPGVYVAVTPVATRP